EFLIKCSKNTTGKYIKTKDGDLFRVIVDLVRKLRSQKTHSMKWFYDCVAITSCEIRELLTGSRVDDFENSDELLYHLQNQPMEILECPESDHFRGKLHINRKAKTKQQNERQKDLREMSVMIKKCEKILNFTPQPCYYEQLKNTYLHTDLSSLVTDVLEKAVSEKRNPDFLDLFKALQAEPQCYGCVSKLMEIALTLPITSCSVERVFSKLKIVKSGLRSTMNQNRLENLIHMSVEVDLLENLDLDSLVQKFTDCAPRRMNLV
ncbi:zinc finger MYM-type 1-like, partial [Paramuricea clavata]